MMSAAQKLMSRPGGRPSLRAVCASLLVATLLLGSIVLWRSSHHDVPEVTATIAADVRPQAPMELTHRPSLLVVGDDFASGYGGIPRNAYPYILCNSVNVNCNVDAQSGTGLLNDGRAYSPDVQRLTERLEKDYEWYNVDLVVVDAGRNDSRAPVTSLSRALDKYLARVAQLWPDARIVVLAPAQLSSVQAPDYPARVAAMGDVVSRHGGVLIDPAAEGWYDGVDLSTIRTEDGLHPTPLGHQLIARKLGEALHRYGIIETDVG